MMKELYDTPIRVTEIQPGMVETCESSSISLPYPLSKIETGNEDGSSGFASMKANSLSNDATWTAFSITRFRGDEQAAKKVYEGFQPLTAEDVAEDIVWAASRKDHM
jgi:NADP-dependent 3-hydroxy acid dehydrogenase YdfG